MSRCRHSRAALASLVFLLTVAVTWLWAHEGHAPLPTRGAQVDLAKGLITLSPEARDVLNVKTAEVEPRAVEEKVLAYATLVAPWQQHAYATTRLPGRVVKVRAMSPCCRAGRISLAKLGPLASSSAYTARMAAVPTVSRPGGKASTASGS